MVTNKRKLYFLSPDPMQELNIASSAQLNRLGMNSGNLAFTRGLVNLFDKTSIDQDSFLGYFNGSKNYNFLPANSLVVIPLANHIDLNRNLKKLGDFFVELSRKGIEFLVFGLGSQFSYGLTLDEVCRKLELSNGFLEFIKGLHYASAITVRGEFTKDILSFFGVNSIPLSCPSVFINTSNPFLGKVIQSKIDFLKGQGFFNVCINTLKDIKLKNEKLLSIEEKLYSLNLKKFYVHQTSHFNGCIPDTNNINDDLSLSSEDVFRRVLASGNFNSIIPFSIPEWIDFLDKNDIQLNIGMRMHGNMVALSQEIVSIIIPIDMRMQEIVDKLKVPYVNINDLENLSVDSILECIKFDAQSFDFNRAESARSYMSILKENRLQCSVGLKFMSENNI